MSKKLEEKRKRRAKRVAKRVPRPTRREGTIRIEGPEMTNVPALGAVRITDEPIEDPAYDALPEEFRAELRDLWEDPSDEWTDPIPRLERAVKFAPHIPRLHNLLAAAYEIAGREADARRVALETYEKFPDYLFAIVNRVNLAVADRRLDEVPGILQGRVLLQDFEPGRTVYHETEAIAFAQALANYHAACGNIDAAKCYFGTWYYVEAMFAD